MSDTSQPDQTASPASRTRREVLAVGAVAAAGAVGVVSLSGCGSSSGAAGPPRYGVGSSPTGTSNASQPAASGGGGGLVKLADVPVGGAVSANGPNGPAIVAQPTAGQVVAFSAKCTHRGCTVAPAGKELDCPCHGSVYDAFTGQVLHGPAPAALAPISVTVKDGEVVVSA